VRGVIFDFGGVLWDMRWEIARDLDRAHGLPRSSVFETLYRTGTWEAIERGRGDRQAWLDTAHKALEERAGRPLPPLHEEWRRSQCAIEPNLQLVRDLRSAYKLAILSNADLSLRGRLEGDMGIHHLFDDVVCSAEVGMAKPEAGIYALAAERLGLHPGECVFVDDLDTNVEAARQVGMQAVLFRVDRGDDLRAQLAALDVAPRR
jgi:putative hydrolase of the HAD superfamily